MTYVYYDVLLRYIIHFTIGRIKCELFSYTRRAITSFYIWHPNILRFMDVVLEVCS